MRYHASSACDYTLRVHANTQPPFVRGPAAAAGNGRADAGVPREFSIYLSVYRSIDRSIDRSIYLLEMGGQTQVSPVNFCELHNVSVCICTMPCKRMYAHASIRIRRFCSATFASFPSRPQRLKWEQKGTRRWPCRRQGFWCQVSMCVCVCLCVCVCVCSEDLLKKDMRSALLVHFAFASRLECMQ